MSFDTQIYLAGILSFVIFGMLLLRRGLLDPLVVQLLFYLFFAFGPLINFLRGETIYFGTKIEFIPATCWIFLCAVTGLALPGFFKDIKKDEFRNRIADSSPLATVLRPANLFMSLVSLSLIVKLIGLGGLGSDKIKAISIVGRELHYPYLLVELYLTAFYFNIGKEKIDRRLFFLNFFLWLIYCLLLAERDFIFTVLSLGIHWVISRPKTKGQTLKFVFGSVVLGILATGLFLFRDATQSFSDPLTSFLGQGSLLFVNSFTVFLIATKLDHFMGYSYLMAIGNLLPSWIYSTGFNLPEWFRMQYAPGSPSGYGFGLDAEGYLNFGYAGVFVTFLLLGLYQRGVFNSRRLPDFFIYYSVFSTSFTMYSFRNDSTAFFKGNLYAVLTYLVFHFLSRFLRKKVTEVRA